MHSFLSRLRQTHRLGRRTNNHTRRRTARLAEAAQVLEDRTLLASIDWANQLISDNFDLFGSDELAARSIVSRAIHDWEQVIEDFNYADGTNTFFVSITADTTAAPGEANIELVDSLGKPTHAEVRMNPNQSWYFDPNVGLPGLPDDAEFEQFISPFASRLGTGESDFYASVLHELGHAMGISSSHDDLAIHDFLVEDSVTDDPNNLSQIRLLPISEWDPEKCAFIAFPESNPGFVLCFDVGDFLYGYDVDGGGIDYTLTTAGSSAPGGHFYEGADDPLLEVAGLTTHPNDLMNDGRTWSKDVDEDGDKELLRERRLISDTDAQFLSDVYGYAVNMPSQINTFYANLNTLTGELLVQGDAGDSDDDIRIDIFGGQLRVQVNGTSELFDFADVSSISVEGYEGHDVIRIDELPPGMPTTVDGGDGDDVMRIAENSGHLETLHSDVTLHGFFHEDFVYLYDQNHLGHETYTVDMVANINTITRTGLDYTIFVGPTVDRVFLEGEQGNSVFNIYGTPINTRIDMDGGAGDDVFNIGLGSVDAIGGTLAVLGGTGDDAIVYDDSNETDSSVYIVGSPDVFPYTSASIGRNNSGHVIYDFVETVDVYAGTNADTIDVNTTPGGVDVELFAGPGGDAINVKGVSFASHLTVRGEDGDDSIVVGDGDLDSNIDGDLSIDGGGESDLLSFDDSSDESGTDSYQLTAFTFSKTGTALWNYAQVEDVELLANQFDNEINVTALSNIEATLDGQGGEDTFNIGAGLLSTITGDVTVIGGGDDDTVLVNNQSDVAGETYTFLQSLGNNLDVTGAFGVLTYDTVESLAVNAGTAGDVFKMFRAPAETTIELNGSEGEDDFQIGGGDLELLAGPVVVDGGPDDDDLTLDDQADDGDDDYTITSSSVAKTGFVLDYLDVESLTLNANPFRNTIDLESVLQTTPVRINSGGQDDTIHLAPTAQDLTFIQGPVFVNGQGGDDHVILHDEANAFGSFSYDVTHNLVTRPRFELHYEETERLQFLLGGAADHLDILSTAPNMHVVVETAGGADSIFANVPTPAQLTLDGGGGNDTVELLGTAASEQVSVSAGPGADVGLISFENAVIDMAGGSDLLRLQGVEGVDEQVEVQATTTAHEGTLSVLGLLDLVFHNTEFLDLDGNAGDADTAAFVGTSQIDEFFINLAADGTLADPVLELFSPGAAVPLLTLLDYQNFGTLEVRGEDGADVFDVFVAAAGPGSGRDLLVDGGEPGGGPGGKDELNVFFETGSPPPPPMPPNIDHDNDNQNDSGTFDIEYDLLHQFFIEYLDIEKALAKSGAAG